MKEKGILLVGAGLAFFAFAVLVLFRIMKRLSKEKEEMISEEEGNVQEFMNISSVRDKFLYSNSKKVFTFIQIQAMDINLLSKNELRILAKNLTIELSFLDVPFKLIAVSKPTDISGVLGEYEELKMSSVDPIQKQILRNESEALLNFAMQGDVVERQFYIALWQDAKKGAEEKLQRTAEEFCRRFDTCKIPATQMLEPDIVFMLSLINNPHYAVPEENVDRTVPMID